MVVTSAKSEVSPGALAVILAMPAAGVVEYVAIAEISPALITAVSLTTTIATFEVLTCTTMSRGALVGFPLRSVRATTNLPAQDVTTLVQVTMRVGWANSLSASAGNPRTVTVARPESKAEAEAVMSAEPGTNPLA